MLLDLRADRILSANRAAAGLLAIEPGNPPAFSRLVGRSMPRFLVFLQEVEHRSEAWTRSVRLSNADGEGLGLELRARLLPDEPGLLLLVLLDLSELARRAEVIEASALQRAGLGEWKRAQTFFAELERGNQLILNAAGEGIYGVNAQGEATFVNRAAQEMLGWTSEDLMGENMHSKIHHHHLSGDVYAAHDCPIYRSFRFEQVHRIEDEVFWRKDGKPIRVEYVSTPIYDQKVLVGAVVIFRDITERKENERKLREALDEVAALRDRLEQENAYLQETITTERAHHDIIGTSAPIRQLVRRVELVAETDATVLITGETGTGKALVATSIHKDSARRKRPLIHFKCGSVAPDAVEAELFGQMRGAFVGALRDRPGRLELAHGGTLFLDDVEELPSEVQGRLLQTLTAGAVTRLGDTRARSLDLRVIAATTTDPDRAVAQDRLREDLLLHLSVFPIHCRPLRDRREDIPALAAHMLDLACRRLNRPVPVITEGTMRAMVEYDWPGNVRELRNVVERGAIVSKGGKLVVELGADTTNARRGTDGFRPEAEMQQMIRDNLIACLRETGGRVSGAAGAAEMLGLPATTVYSRMRKFGIDRAALGARDGTA
ncbi:sigma 54-interacting transcriptional regulator [Citreimonas salinaria]|uniref:Nif-specific regulatory protein n=1 Tax=Citreimonas salinaria TaxID=321339 RepID=A0A1H3K3Q9_9RHOB|nr:sigma 54-interacting transcriptional regulator [Citreimonas salinaria]SDY46459.1 PAS domain S-box-containing protein [Citreimonas salinaria]